MLSVRVWAHYTEKAGIGSKEAANDDGDAVGIYVMDEEDLRLQDYIDAGISELKRIAAEQKLPEDELRICFAFDC